MERQLPQEGPNQVRTSPLKANWTLVLMQEESGLNASRKAGRVQGSGREAGGRPGQWRRGRAGVFTSGLRSLKLSSGPRGTPAGTSPGLRGSSVQSAYADPPNSSPAPLPGCASVSSSGAAEKRRELAAAQRGERNEYA